MPGDGPTAGGRAPRPLRLGYWLSSEEHAAPRLVEHAVAAEAAGFTTAMLSDHLHPWVPQQGHSPFAWTVLGALAQATTTLEVGTGVSAALHRMHPVVLAHAAATVATLMPGRTFLGLGTGERLNEQLGGARWPPPAERREVLEEAITVIRRLWAGGEVHHRGRHVTVEGVQLHSLPASPPPLHVAASGPRSARLAGEAGDGLIAVAPDPTIVQAYEAAGGTGPKLGQLHVCWARDEAEARRTAHRWWPNGGMRGAVLSELSRPSQFAEVAKLVREDDVADAVVCGPDLDRHVAAIHRFVAAGFDTVYVHQVGPDQAGFLHAYRDEVLPRWAGDAPARG
jgi:coenzyme F420-dependent glucose-6-phosphate dehydrogenase